MPLFELTHAAITKLEETTFEREAIAERTDLQRLLKQNIEVIAPDTLIIADEFCEWDESKRRIDLLGLDQDANLVVIELKRTEDGGHMELQAVRYAAMVSAMTFSKAVEVYARYLAASGSSMAAEAEILDFLGWESANEDKFGENVRIVLVSAEFSKEITTSVMWLNECGLDVRCVRLRRTPWIPALPVIGDTCACIRDAGCARAVGSSGIGHDTTDHAEACCDDMPHDACAGRRVDCRLPGWADIGMARILVDSRGSGE